MRLLAKFFREFTELLDRVDALYLEKSTIDEKTYPFLCLALSIKGRSKPCVLKHFRGALEVGATVKELLYIFALVNWLCARPQVLTIAGPMMSSGLARPS